MRLPLRDGLPQWARDQLLDWVRVLQATLAIEHDETGQQRQTWVLVAPGAAQGVANNTVTRVAWALPLAELGTGLALAHDGSGQVTITRPGLYRVSAQVRWATDAVGYRRLEIRGPDQRRVAMDTRAAFANIQTIQGVSTDVAVTVPTVMSVWVAQTSGGALPLETGSPDRDAFFSIVRMA